MIPMMKVLKLSLFAVAISSLFSSCSYNSMVAKDETVNEAWANVQAAYQERYDLVDNLVETVKGYANFEKETLTAVIEARSKATGMNVNAGDLTPENLEKFEAAQSQLSGTLSRLMVVVEKYPDLKANENYKELMAQLSRLEQKINVSRRDYNATVRDYNTTIRKFPSNLTASMFGFEPKQPFKSEAGAEKAPKVKFD